jgi:hypothetical protein
MILQIDTASALSKMNDTYDHVREEVKTYGLRFVSKNGFREIYNARKGVKHPKQQSKSDTSKRGKSNKKFNGLVQVFDDDIQQFRDIKFAQIVAFRDYKEKTWIPVKLI